MNRKQFHPIYLLALFYVISAYLVPVLFNHITEVAEEGSMPLWILAIPVILGAANFMVIKVTGKSIGRDRLLNCAVLVKYLLIPFYIGGGLLNVIFFLLMFTPVVIMVFVSPTVIMLLSITGWLIMAGAAPYFLAYLSESQKQKIHGTALCVIAGILQFFFVADVISVMVLAWKEKRCIKVTIVTAVLLFTAGLAAVAGLIIYLCLKL